MNIKYPPIVFLLVPAVLFLTGCGSAPSSATAAVTEPNAGAGANNILASTTFLADITQNVAGDRAKVVSLLPIGTDPHSYQAAPADVAKIAGSNLVILNGLEYEHFIETLLENAGGERLVVEAASGLEPHAAEDPAEGSAPADGLAHGAGDPHMWLDPNLVITYVENIRAGLTEVDPAGAETYKVNANRYIAQLKDLDKWIVEQVKTIPAGQRLLVTNHEAVWYFADRYGFEVVGTIIPSQSTDSATSAKELAALIEQIKSTGASAIFLGEVENSDLANQIAADSKVRVVGNLHLESLTNGPPAATYIDMMKYNVTQIVDGLK